MRALIFLALCLSLSACAVGFSLAPTPNLYREGTNYPEAGVAPVLRTASPSIFFVTDRVPEGASYGSERSESMAFGAATVKFGQELSWQELLTRTRADSTEKVSTLWVPEVEEFVRFEETPLPYRRVGDRLSVVPASAAAYGSQEAAFQNAVRAKMRETGNGRLLVYVHGFNNDFEDSLTTLANVWHFSGRASIPIAFTWPAGNGRGVLGYFRDRDSGTFSVHHTKEFLRMLAQIPEVEEIDILAHSRGTAVATSALRELIIEARGAGKHPRKAWKLGTLIMAAPDLAVDIVRQRLAAERFSEGFEQMNLYINPNDRALFISSLLSRTTRVGSLTPKDFRPGEVDALKNEARVHFIRVEGLKGGFGHSYFRENPAVLSDIALALRTRALPGSEYRPLERDENGIWVAYPNYPLKRLPDLGVLARREAERDAR